MLTSTIRTPPEEKNPKEALPKARYARPPEMTRLLICALDETAELVRRGWILNIDYQHVAGNEIGKRPLQPHMGVVLAGVANTPSRTGAIGSLTS